MKQFYKSSYLFWVTSRIILVIAGFLDTFRIYLNYKTFTGSSFITILYLIAMSIIFYSEITKANPAKFLKYCTGIFTILIGLFIAYLKFSEPKPSWGIEKTQFDYMKIVAIIFSSWLILLGIFDFFTFNSDSEN